MRISDWSSDVCSSDLQGDVVDALGDHPRRLHGRLVVLQGDGIVGRVGDHHVGLGHRRHHALARALDADLAQAALDQRVAFRLLVLVFHLLLGHAQLFVVHEALIDDVSEGDQGHHREHADDDLGCLDLHQRQHVATGMVGITSTSLRSGQTMRPTTTPTTASLTMPLPKSASARVENIFLKPRFSPMLESLGRICSVVTMMPVWMVPAASPAARIMASGTSETFRSAKAVPDRMSPRPPSSRAMRCGRSRKGRSTPPRSALSEGAKMPTTSASARIMNQCDTSWERATWPFSRASESRLPVGS